jgi:hypothetical protein
MISAAPIGIGDIAAALGMSSGDLGYLYTEGNEANPQGLIKMWSRYKPFRDSTVGYETVALNQAAAKEADYGLVRNDGGPLCQNTALEELYCAAQTWPFGKWVYQRPRGQSQSPKEWFRMFDMVGYNANAVNPPINVIFTTPDRTHAKFQFQYPGNGSGWDTHIRDFKWYTASVSSGTYAKSNWKYGLLDSAVVGATVPSQLVYSRTMGLDIYDSSGNYKTDPNATGTRIGWEYTYTLQRGRRRYFVPFITRLPADSSTIYYSDSVYLHTDQTDRYSLPNTVTTQYMTDVWFGSVSATPFVGTVNWDNLIRYGGTITINSFAINGKIINYEKAQDDAVDISFRLASNYNGYDSVTAEVSAEFYAPSPNSTFTNYYDGGSSNGHHSRITFTIPASPSMIARGNELYLQVYDHGTLLDEYYFYTIPNS